MAHRIWKETKQEPGTAGPGNMLGCCLVSYHFLRAILSTSTVEDNILVYVHVHSITLQASASALLASMEKDRELLRIFLKVSQMENTILRRMNLSSFLMVSCYLKNIFLIQL